MTMLSQNFQFRSGFRDNGECWLSAACIVAASWEQFVKHSSAKHDIRITYDSDHGRKEPNYSYFTLNITSISSLSECASLVNWLDDFWAWCERINSFEDKWLSAIEKAHFECMQSEVLR